MCIHIDSTTLADVTYNLVPESESEQREAQVNLTEVAEDPNQRPEEPPTGFVQEGKPRCIGVDWNPSCMILGTFVMTTRTGSSSIFSANRYGKSRVVSNHSREL
jgi:hypothetical protein